jgi:hypothetical protein
MKIKLLTLIQAVLLTLTICGSYYLLWMFAECVASIIVAVVYKFYLAPH